MRTRLAALLAAPLLLAVGACSGDDGPGDADSDTPEDILAAARATLDETPGVQLLLETSNLPDGVSGVVRAEGIGTHQPAFEGSIDVVYSGLQANVPLTAVDGVVYAQLPFTSSQVEVNPAEYGAPDPAGLMDTEVGISAWLTSATDVTEGDQVRDGGDVLTSYSGSLPGTAVVSVIPSADDTATFEVTFTIDDDGVLRTASVDGPFYKGEPELTYDVTLTDYGTELEITAP